MDDKGNIFLSNIQCLINGKILNLYNLTITFNYGDTFNKFPYISYIATQKHISQFY